MKTKLEYFGALTPAEEKLRERINTGLFVPLGDGGLPTTNAGADCRVRASFISYLVMGGCEACRPSAKGVRLKRYPKNLNHLTLPEIKDLGTLGDM